MVSSKFLYLLVQEAKTMSLRTFKWMFLYVDILKPSYHMKPTVCSKWILNYSENALRIMAMKVVCCGVLCSKYYNTITRDVEQPNFITQNFKLKTLRSSLFVKS